MSTDVEAESTPPDRTTPKSPPVRVAVAVSGRGRLLDSLVAGAGHYGSYRVTAAICDPADCAARSRAANVGLAVFDQPFPKTSAAPTQTHPVFAWLAEHAIEWVILAGFLRFFPVPSSWRGRVINIHPALLPRHGGPGMYGRHVHEAVLAAGDHQTGATVHVVTPEIDAGPILAQVTVPVAQDDDARSLAERVFECEKRLLPWVVDKVVRGVEPPARPLCNSEVLRW